MRLDTFIPLYLFICSCSNSNIYTSRRSEENLYGPHDKISEKKEIRADSNDVLPVDNDQNPNNVTQAGDENILTQIFSRNKVKFNRNKTLFNSVVCMNFVIKIIRFLRLMKTTLSFLIMLLWRIIIILAQCGACVFQRICIFNKQFSF